MVMESKKSERGKSKEKFMICVRTSYLQYMIILGILELYGLHENGIYQFDSGNDR